MVIGQGVDHNVMKRCQGLGLEFVASPGSGPTAITDSLNPITSEATKKNEEDHGGPKGAMSPIHRRLRKVPVWTQDFIMG